MSTKDILLYESGSGGELSVVNFDIELAEQLFQQCYLALFGGNIEAVTLGNETAGEPRDDWWGNTLLFPEIPEVQFNSTTERALRDNPLTSSGRVNIQRAAESDLQYLKSIADVTVNVVILDTNSVAINITIRQPATQSGAIYQIIWDSAKQEVITIKHI